MQIEQKSSIYFKHINEVKTWLEKEIQYLLDHDFQKLIQILYRIDIPEEKAKEILNNTNPGQMSTSFAELIIARELLKVEMRRKYKS